MCTYSLYSVMLASVSVCLVYCDAKETISDGKQPFAYRNSEKQQMTFEIVSVAYFAQSLLFDVCCGTPRHKQTSSSFHLFTSNFILAYFKTFKMKALNCAQLHWPDSQAEVELCQRRKYSDTHVTHIHQL